MVDTATSEAVQLRNKLLTKKQSIENSIESMKKSKAKSSRSTSEIKEELAVNNNETITSTTTNANLDDKTPDEMKTKISTEKVEKIFRYIPFF